MTELPSPGGERNRLRILAETMQHLDGVVAESESLGERTAAEHWSGQARDAADAVRLGLDTEWERLRDTHGRVTRGVTGFSTFLYELPKLAEDFPHLAAERGPARDRVIAELLSAATALDELGVQRPRRSPPPPPPPPRPTGRPPAEQAIRWPEVDLDLLPDPEPPPAEPVPVAGRTPPPPDGSLAAAVLTSPRDTLIPWHG
ncbi:hypothetical protein [Actinokineospora bangkokensis]|uniref:Uncharacterized protein n=1 Tax=Actinokineospora bangkokensis TaxID=1193682 RepID=A0A1Q9LFG5_9PSEU|nr:hypothetical protein [Actinokineospora bangkokensis]OLR90709.1 hypothetical protein BJP25_29375 [Actinokineospora bangkokensis]